MNGTGERVEEYNRGQTRVLIFEALRRNGNLPKSTSNASRLESKASALEGQIHAAHGERLAEYAECVRSVCKLLKDLQGCYYLSRKMHRKE